MKLEEFIEEKFFKEILGYGFRCVKCHTPGTIINIGSTLVEFECKNCKKKWGFTFTDEARKTINHLFSKNKIKFEFY